MGALPDNYAEKLSGDQSVTTSRQCNQQKADSPDAPSGLTDYLITLYQLFPEGAQILSRHSLIEGRSRWQRYR